MYPACSTTNKIYQPISDAFLRERYSLTEEYAKNHPEDFAKVLSAVRCIEENIQIMDRLEQDQKECSNGMARLREGSEVILARLDNIIELEKKNTEALQNLVNSSSEMKQMTSNIANFAKRFFNPVRNGFYFLTGHREPAAVLSRGDQLAIKDNPENTIPNTGPANQTSGDVKKKSQAY